MTAPNPPETTPEPSNLYPTQTRLALLRDVDQGIVWRDDRDGQAYLGSGTGGRKASKVTAAVDELLAAGWIEKRLSTSAVYRLTTAGRAVLAKGGAQ